MYIGSIKSFKKNLRKHYKNIRVNLKEECKLNLDYEIYSKITSLAEYKNSKIIMTYVSKEIEVDTFAFIKKSLKDKKIVAVPKCIPEQKLMDFYIINSLNDLEIGTFGVLEPIKSKCKILNNYHNSLCIVPGFSFDYEGYRLGYGKGYYDRFLNNFPGITLGICYSNCVRKQLPHGYFDKPVNLLVTDEYIINIGRTFNER